LATVIGSDGIIQLSQVESYSFVHRRWSSLKNMIHPRTEAASCTFHYYNSMVQTERQQIYVFGGRHEATSLATCEVFEPEVNLWSPITSECVVLSS
jgi:hypothetical protein